MMRIRRIGRLSVVLAALAGLASTPLEADAATKKDTSSGEKSGSKKKAPASKDKTERADADSAEPAPKKKKKKKKKAAKEEAVEKKTVAVGQFKGSWSGSLRKDVIAALKDSGEYEVTEAEDLKASAKEPAIAEIGKGLLVQAVVMGEVKKGFHLALRVHHGSDGALVEEVEIKGGNVTKLKNAVKNDAAETLSGPVAQAKAYEEPKAEAEPAAAATDDGGADDEQKDDSKDEDEPEDSAPTGPRPSPLDVTAGLRPYNRVFEFKDAIEDVRPGQGFRPLLRYSLPVGPALFIDLNFYPGAFSSAGPLSWIGITGGFEKGFATNTIVYEGTPAETTLGSDLTAFYVGARFRLPIAKHQLSASATYGSHAFKVTGDEPQGEPLGACPDMIPQTGSSCVLVPDVEYSYIRIGLDGWFRINDFLLGLRVGKRLVSGTGPLETEPYWFNNTKAQSLEAGFTVGYRLLPPLDLVAGFDWLRYGFDFNPVEPKPPRYESYVAGGATDQYLMGHIGFRLTLPGGGNP
jgi:hypothetical protein